MTESKVELRKQYINFRKSIENKKEKSHEIFKRIIDLDEYKNCKVIALYKSLESEVNTDELIDYSFNKGIVVALPRVIGNDLKFYKISDQENFEKSNFGVEEPIEDINNFVSPSLIDLVIVPGVCFDTHKNRYGFGKGFYDRVLASTSAKSVAICFEEQVIKDKELPVDYNDIKVDKIVTDKNIYT